MRGWWSALGFLLAIPAHGEPDPPPTTGAAAMREEMVRTQIEARGISDPAVLRAMRTVPRHLFVPPAQARHAHEDGPLPIGHRQTISQPYVVAFMTAALELDRGDRVLEIGTGSGYQAAVLAELGAEVWTIEIVAPLAQTASAALTASGHQGPDAPTTGPGAVHTRVGDGYRGWPADEGGPESFDAIVVTAAPDHVPQPLVDQLAPGGRMVIPVGGRTLQELLVIEKATSGEITRRSVLPVLFVPMTGEAQAR